MSFENICRSYLQSLASELETAERTGAATPELSFRTPLDNFFSKVCAHFGSDIDKIHEPANEGEAGRPDWRFSNKQHQGLYGYVEGKPLDLENQIDVASHYKQIKRYLSLDQKVILTDGLDFAIWEPARQNPDVISLIQKPVDRSALTAQELDPRLETGLRDFFQHAAARRCNEGELVRQAALRANQISEGVRGLVVLSPEQAVDADEKSTIETLRALREILEEHHDPTMRSPKIFGSFIAQVLIFGLLYTHRLAASDDRSPTETYEYLHSFWSTPGRAAGGRLRPFKALVDLLDQELKEGKLGDVGTWYDDFRHFLSFVDLDQSQRADLDYHQLYEQFLEEFDSDQRWEYGAFYTPPHLVDFVINLVFAITSSHLPNISLYDKGNKLLDPCCGTGSFLEALIAKAPDESGAEIAGFEVLPAPYALSHYRMSMISDDAEYPSGVSIVLTNTLSDQLATKPGKTLGNIVNEEQREAWRLSKPPLLLIIGNPPSRSSSLDNRSSGKHFQIIEERLDDFRPPEPKRTSRSNVQKQVRNTFMKFLRWSCEKIDHSPRGILAFVLPSSFSTGESYKYARRSLLHQFRQLWVLDLDRDGRTGETAYSLFGTRQGRTLIVGLHEGTNGKEDTSAKGYYETDKGDTTASTNIGDVNGRSTSRAQVHYASITGRTESEKHRFLTQERDKKEYLSLFNSFVPSNPGYEFRPGKSYPEDLWIDYWPLKSDGSEDHIFDRHCSGVKCAPTHFVVHADKHLLKRRTSDLARSRKQFTELRERWFNGMSRPPSQDKWTPDVISALRDAVANWEDSIVSYSYRPFITCHAVLTDSLMSALKNTKGGGTRDRPELRSAFKSEEVIGIGIANSPSSLGTSIHRFASFCWNLPDNDLVHRGSVRVLCNKYPENKKIGEEWNPRPFQNISSKLLGLLKNSYGRDVTGDEVVYYIYAVISSDVYLNKFEGALFGSSINPRIPIPRNKSIFEYLCKKGKKIAKLERLEYNIKRSEIYDKYESKFDKPFKLDNPIYYNWYTGTGSKLNIVLKNRTKKAEEIVLTNIKSEVVNCEISGNRPVYEWLKLHSFPYLRRDLRKDDYIGLLELLSRVDLQLDLIRQASAEVNQITSADVELIVPPSGQS